MGEVTGGQGRETGSMNFSFLIWLFAPFQKKHA
jgi:hypothetical protein